MRSTFRIAASGVSRTFGLLATGAAGVKEKVEPEKPETENMYTETTENLKKIARGMHG